jgi:hypothetical protein
MDPSNPALLILLADASFAAGWLPAGPAGWILPIAMFALGAGLVRRLGRSVNGDVSGARARRGASLPRYRRSQQDLESELERTRRGDRSLATLVVRLDPSSIADLEQELEAAGAGKNGGTAVRCTIHTVFAVIGAIIDDCLRGIDLATVDPASRRYIVLLPETTREQAEDTVRRMASVIFDETGLQIRAGIAEFRTDGVLLDDLVQVATAACDQEGALEIVSRSTRPRALSHG